MNVRSPSETAIPSLRERIRQATAAAILDAAEQVFAEQGLDGARMDRLVKRGVKEKALRPSGAELYPALLMGIIRALIIRERIYGVQLTPPDVKEALRCFLEGAQA